MEKICRKIINKRVITKLNKKYLRKKIKMISKKIKDQQMEPRKASNRPNNLKIHKQQKQ
jgi:hypothetical protein